MFFINSFIKRVIKAQMNEFVKILNVALSLISKKQEVVN